MREVENDLVVRLVLDDLDPKVYLRGTAAKGHAVLSILLHQDIAELLENDVRMLGAIAALFMFSWQAMIATAILWWVAGSLGVGMGFHRLLTHRGYKTVTRVRVYRRLTDR